MAPGAQIHMNPAEIVNVQCQERAKAELSLFAFLTFMTYEITSFADV